VTYDEKLEAITAAMGEGYLAAHGEKYIHGYFDAKSPAINDLYRWEVLVMWLRMEGFKLS
jgi:hypothetical protein